MIIYQGHRQVREKDSFAFVETVRGNMEGFTVEQVKQAKLAHDAMAMMVHPSMQRMKQLVSKNTIVIRICHLPQPTLLCLVRTGGLFKVKVRRKPSRMRPDLIKVPLQVYERLKLVTLTADMMFVNGLSFFITKSRGIKLITVQFLPSRTVNRLVESFYAVMRVYRRGGFIVETCLMDIEFTKIVDKVTEVIILTLPSHENTLLTLRETFVQ